MPTSPTGPIAKTERHETANLVTQEFDSPSALQFFDNLVQCPRSPIWQEATSSNGVQCQFESDRGHQKICSGSPIWQETLVRDARQCGFESHPEYQMWPGTLIRKCGFA